MEALLHSSRLPRRRLVCLRGAVFIRIAADLQETLGMLPERSLDEDKASL